MNDTMHISYLCKHCRHLKLNKETNESTKTLIVNIEELLTTETDVSTATWETGVISPYLVEIELTFLHRVHGAEPLNERGRVTGIPASVVTRHISKLWTS